MCDPISAGVALASLAATKVLAPEMPTPPTPEAPKPPPQGAKQADQSAVRGAATAGGGSGSSTMLTGPGGVAPNLLSIGKNTLLGA